MDATMDDRKTEKGHADVIKAADTIEETIVIRDNRLVKNMPQCADGSAIAYSKGIVIDIDDAKWQKEYAAKMERNLDRFKELGLYRQLEDIGIFGHGDGGLPEMNGDVDEDGIEWTELQNVKNLRVVRSSSPTDSHGQQPTGI